MLRNKIIFNVTNCKVGICLCLCLLFSIDHKLFPGKVLRALSDEYGWYMTYSLFSVTGALSQVSQNMFSNLYIYLVVEKIKLGYQITLKLNMCTLFSQLSLPDINCSIAKYHKYILNCVINKYALDIGYIYMWLRIEILRARDLYCISMWK